MSEHGNPGGPGESEWNDEPLSDAEFAQFRADTASCRGATSAPPVDVAAARDVGLARELARRIFHAQPLLDADSREREALRVLGAALEMCLPTSQMASVAVALMGPRPRTSRRQPNDHR